MAGRRKRLTLRDIADETGLSVAAVSYALRGIQVPEETQVRVREAADRLGYEADPIARALASGRTDTVGVLCGSLEDNWQQSVAAALGRALLEAGLTSAIVDAVNDPLTEVTMTKRLVDQHVDAIITLPLDPRSPHWVEAARDVPIVAVGDGLPGAATAAEVVFDNTAGVTDGLTRLADAGHTRVALLTPGGVETPDRPAEAVVRKLAPTLGVYADFLTTPHDLEAASQVVQEVLSSEDPPTAFLCLSDSIAYGVYAAAAELGRTIPDDLSVIGYDDRPVSRLLSPPLSTYRWPMAELVATVVKVTTKAIDGRHSRRKVLPPTPQPRASVGPPPR
jgi:LacI family transcriptional regulator